MRFFLSVLSALTLAACANVADLAKTKTYYSDVQQGNVLSQEAVAQLRPGLTRDQVRYLIGSPLLTDVFHGQRWDYVYRLQRDPKTEPVIRRFTVFFDKEGLLERVAGDLEPAPVVSKEAPTRPLQVIEIEKPEEPLVQKGIWDRLKGRLWD